MYLSSYTGQLRGKLYTCIVNEGDKTMDYNDVIRNKNRILAITLLICIVLRCIVNTFFTGIVQVIPMGIGGLIFTALLLLLNKKVHPVVMMYAMVVLMSAISIILMIAFPCTTNYLMFFLSIFFVVIYEDIRPIIMQSAISAAAMVYFYFRYTQEFLVDGCHGNVRCLYCQWHAGIYFSLPPDQRTVPPTAQDPQGKRKGA